MKRWDLVLFAAAALLVIAAAGVDWRLACATAGVALAAVWYWLDDDGEG